jgi:hypothetical protein
MKRKTLLPTQNIRVCFISQATKQQSNECGLVGAVQVSSSSSGGGVSREAAARTIGRRFELRLTRCCDVALFRGRVAVRVVSC